MKTKKTRYGVRNIYTKDLIVRPKKAAEKMLNLLGEDWVFIELKDD